MKTWLVIDVSYMCHRAFHTSGHLSFQGKATGVVFGFLKSIGQLKEEFQTDNIAFCFEHPHLFRKDIYLGYKQRRHNRKLSDVEVKSRFELKRQIQDLHTRHLPRIGFKNVFCYEGMESDDIMAAIALNCDPDEEVILVTADSDLYQCLRPNVFIYSPQKQHMVTVNWFVKRYKIHPKVWSIVKALCGCKSDEVPGIHGIGEITALSCVRGDLKKGTDYYNRIYSKEGRATVKRNRQLVELPFKGCPVPKLQQDKIDRDGWMAVCKELGMRSLAGMPPIYGKL
jgi:5'-3' exonuclease